MKHLILGKLKKDEFLDYNEIENIFSSLLSMDDISKVRVLKKCVNRDNRYDIMIEITMKKDALSAYDQSSAHMIWKEKYCPKLECKAIFDYEE